jgi:sorbitol-specific phosphotransferase system component IIA
LEEISEKLSELGATLDRFGGNQRKSCPNLVELQTGLEEISEKLSELGATSARFEGNQRKAVRT